ncbi:hypothetical protein ABPG74_016618 [Tetrahymena malaccensis]
MSGNKELDKTWNQTEQQKKKPLAAVGDGLALLSPEGNRQYKELQIQSFKQFSLWFLVGNLTGLTLSQVVQYLPINNITKMKKRKYQRVAFFGSIFVLSYHGYKLSKREFVRGKKKILLDPECIVNEPDN